MTSKYLQCDQCGKTLGAEEVIKHRPPKQWDTGTLLAKAKDLGWTHEDAPALCSYDLCPDCTQASEKGSGK